MALALISKLEDAELCGGKMTAAIPGVDFRVWPELGDSGRSAWQRPTST